MEPLYKLDPFRYIEQFPTVYEINETVSSFVDAKVSPSFDASGVTAAMRAQLTIPEELLIEAEENEYNIRASFI